MNDADVDIRRKLLREIVEFCLSLRPNLSLSTRHKYELDSSRMHYRPPYQ
jgi:hypothetical protein